MKTEQSVYSGTDTAWSCRICLADHLESSPNYVQLFLSPERLATRSSDGRICIWDWRQQALVASWKASADMPLADAT